MNPESPFEQELQRRLAQLAERAQPSADLDAVMSRAVAGRTPRRIPKVAIAVAAALVMLVAAVGVAAIRRGGSQQIATGGDVATGTDSTLPLLIPSDVPADFAPYYFASQSIGGGESEGYAQLFVSFDAPGNPRILLEQVKSGGREGYGFPEGTPVTITGHDASVATWSAAGGEVSMVWWSTGPDEFAVVKSVGLAQSELVAFAASISPRVGEPGFKVPAAPRDMSLLVEGRSGTADTRQANIAVYRSSSGAELRVESTDSPFAMLTSVATSGLPARAVTVDGRQGLLVDGSDASASRLYLAWERAPGQWVIVDATDVDEASLMAAVNSIAEVDPATWTALEAANQVSGN